jgi:magnesium-transporting ATPase (P-type)
LRYRHVVGIVFFAFGIYLGRVLAKLLLALGIIVALVPKGLPTVTLPLAAAADRMAARKVLVRRSPPSKRLVARL